jgi:hypothetical protein
MPPATPTTNHTTPTYYCQLVVAVPNSTAKFDFVAHLSKFRTGFGTDYQDQVRPCNYHGFRHGLSYLVGCPHDLAPAFKNYFELNPLFGKYICQVHVLRQVDDVTIKNTHFHCEQMAKDYLVQYLKFALHPCLDHELHRAILDCKTGSELMRYFTEELASMGNYHDNKPTESQLITIPDANLIDSDYSWKQYYSKWYDGNLKSF